MVLSIKQINGAKMCGLLYEEQSNKFSFPRQDTSKTKW